MNVQDVINAALEQARGSSSSVTIAEQRDVGACQSEDVTKLAAALNFIGTHLEDDETKVAAPKDYSDHAFGASVAAGALSGALGARKAKKIYREHGIDPRDVEGLSGMLGGAARGAVGGGLSGLVGGMGGSSLGDEAGVTPGIAVGGALSAVRQYRHHTQGARRLIRTHANIKRREAEREKTSSVDDVLLRAAEFGKASLMSKLAEDRINPAQISAGPAEPFSGEVMPSSSPVFGGAMSNEQLIAMKAQKVRDRINSDMHKYVSNVGDGYELNGYLSTFNK